MSESFSRPAVDESLSTNEMRSNLVATAIETSISLSNTNLLAETLSRESRTQLASANNIADRIVEVRRDLLRLELELQKKKRSLLDREKNYLNEKKKTFALHKSLVKQIELLKESGDNEDREALDAIFFRSIPRQADAPFMLPRDTSCFSISELLHETYQIVNLSNDISVPPESQSKIRAAFLFDDDSEQKQPKGVLKLARVFKRTSKPDIFHFIMSNKYLVETDTVASLYGVVLRDRMFGASFHSQPLSLICWFGKPTSPNGDFPKCVGETFTMCVVGTDYGQHEAIYGSKERNSLTPGTASMLSQIAQQLGIDSESAFPTYTKITIDVNWSDAFWRRRLPLEYIEPPTSSTSQQSSSHVDCSITLSLLAVRMKTGYVDEKKTVLLPSVFSALCYHETTRQIFWHKFDVASIVSMLTHRSERRDVSCCGHANSFANLVKKYEDMQPKDQLSASSALLRLHSSESDVVNSYAILDNLKNSSTFDPAYMLRQSRAMGEADQSFIDGFPEVGYTMVVGALDRNTFRSLVQHQEDDTDNEEQTHATQPNKKKHKTDAVIDTSAESLSTKKRSSACTLCGLPSANRSSHAKPQHGRTVPLSEKEFAAWRKSLVETLGEDEAKKITGV